MTNFNFTLNKRNWLSGWGRAPRKKRVKTPTLLQMEAVECGAAALGIVLEHFGRIVPLEELRVACGVSRDGSKAVNIVKAARQYGLKVNVFAAEPEALAELNVPLIIHWNFNHFLVVEGFHKDVVYLNDPATGPRKVTYEEFHKSFTGIVATFELTDSFEKSGARTSVLAGLRQRLHGSEWGVAFVSLVSLALIIPGFLIPAFSRIFVDYYLVGGFNDWITPLLIGMGLTAVLRMALTWLQQKYLLRLETKIAISSASQVFWYLLKLPIEFFTQRSPGDISSRVGMNDRIAYLLSGELATTVLNTVLIIFYAVLMFQYNVLLTVIIIGIAMLNVVVLMYVARKRTDTSYRLVQDRSKAMAASYSGLQNIETLKATGSEADFFSRWSGYQAKLSNAVQEYGASTEVLSVIPPFLSTFASIVILVIGSLSVIEGEMTLGMLVAFQSLMMSFLGPVNQMIDVGGQLQEVRSLLNRLDDIYNYPSKDQVEITPEEVSAIDFRSLKLTGEIELKDVTFGYSPLDKPLIKEFNLKLKPGARVALVGGSGSGKSTIAKLIAGIHTPWSGEILFDGKTRHEIPRAVLTSSLATVDQDIYLFEGSIKNNLTMWNSSIPEIDIVNAAQDAHIHEEILLRPNGYEFQVSEGGANFSGGQRQRLEIARALTQNPSFLILDEATSALDTVTEKIIDNNLRKRGCSCLIVAHRLSTIRDCDEIIVLDRGQVVERGTHEQLWRSGGHYAQLVRSGSSKSELLMDSILESILS